MIASAKFEGTFAAMAYIPIVISILVLIYGAIRLKSAKVKWAVLSPAGFLTGKGKNIKKFNNLIVLLISMWAILIGTVYVLSVILI